MQSPHLRSSQSMTKAVLSLSRYLTPKTLDAQTRSKISLDMVFELHKLLFLGGGKSVSKHSFSYGAQQADSFYGRERHEDSAAIGKCVLAFHPGVAPLEPKARRA